MMHQTPDSIKFKKLQRRLGCSKRDLVGTLELLWHTTQKGTPQGDIGRFDDEAIAIECDWPGDPAELVEALVETGWLDRCTVHRLVIHDWEQHAPAYIKRQLTRHGKSFVTPTRSPGVTDDVLAAPEVTSDAGSATPNQTKPNQTKPNGASAPGPDGPAFELAEKKAPKKPKASGPVSANPPTVAEVAAYCVSRSNGLDAEAFVAHYTANGWKQSSGRPIVDWRASVVTWEKRRKERDQPATIPMANRRGEYYPSDEELREAIER